MSGFWLLQIAGPGIQSDSRCCLSEEAIFEWYFEHPGTGAGWQSTQEIIAFSDEIQQEDIELCEWVQRGLQSRAYNRGRFSVKRENGVHHFQSLGFLQLLAVFLFLHYFSY